jgi:hypothetical protein
VVKQRFLALVLLILICSSSGLKSAHSADLRGSFSSFAHKVVKDFSTGNFGAIKSSVSAHGLRVVFRHVDVDATLSERQAAQGLAKNKVGVGLSLRAFQPLVWTEEEAIIDKSELKSSDFFSIARQFRELIQNSEDGYPTSINDSLQTTDAWGSRFLGPTIQGKIAANTYWYVYCVREGGEWRIWRLELAAHS